MTDFNRVDVAATMFQARASSSDRRVAAAQSELANERPDDADLLEASEQFESLMLHLMIREMRATVPEGTLLPRSMAEEIFSGMMDETIAGEMAQNGGIGISRMIFEQLQRVK